MPAHKAIKLHYYPKGKALVQLGAFNSCSFIYLLAKLESLNDNIVIFFRQWTNCIGSKTQHQNSCLEIFSRWDISVIN